MKATKKLTKALRALAKALDEEVGKNPDLDGKIEAILDTLAGRTKSKEAASVDSNKERSFSPDVPDVFEELQRLGMDEFRIALKRHDRDLLKAIVSANGFDPEKRSVRWTEPDKFIELICEQTLARLRRGSSFLE